MKMDSITTVLPSIFYEQKSKYFPQHLYLTFLYRVVMYHVSSNVSEVIRAVLIFFFYQKISQAQKAQKVQNAYNQTKTKKAAFLCT